MKRMKFGYVEFEAGMRFVLKGVEYVVKSYGFVCNDSPFDPFGGCNGVETTTGEVFLCPQYFNTEIEVL